MNFEQALREALVACSDKRSNQILQTLAIKKGPVSKIILRRMERRIRTELGLGPNEKIDWSKVDWAAILVKLLPILLAILTMLI